MAVQNDHASLRPLLQPRSVAVLTDGPSPLRGDVAVPVVEAVRRRVRTGEVEYLVRHPVDLAVVSVPPKEILTAVEAAIRAGVGALAVMSGPGGAPSAALPPGLIPVLQRTCRAAGARVLGPGSGLLANLDRRAAIHAGHLLSVEAQWGPLAVVGDASSALARLLPMLESHHLGVGQVVDVGLAADVSVAEVAAWAAAEGRMRAVLVHSSVPCRQALEEAVARLGAPSAPIVLMAPEGPGPSRAGAGPHSAARILPAGTLEELANLALLLVNQPMPAGRHVAFVTNEPWASHAGVNRQLAGAGLLGPDLTQYAEQRSKVLAPGTRMRGAVLSLGPDVSADSFSNVLSTVTDEKGVDVVVVAPSAGPHLHRGDVERVLGTLRQSHPDVVVVAVDQGTGRRAAPWRSSVVPVFDSDTHALSALAGLIRG